MSECISSSFTTCLPLSWRKPRTLDRTSQKVALHSAGLPHFAPSHVQSQFPACDALPWAKRVHSTLACFSLAPKHEGLTVCLYCSGKLILYVRDHNSCGGIRLLISSIQVLVSHFKSRFEFKFDDFPENGFNAQIRQRYRKLLTIVFLNIY